MIRFPSAAGCKGPQRDEKAASPGTRQSTSLRADARATLTPGAGQAAANTGTVRATCSPGRCIYRAPGEASARWLTFSPSGSRRFDGSLTRWRTRLKISSPATGRPTWMTALSFSCFVSTLLVSFSASSSMESITSSITIQGGACNTTRAMARPLSSSALSCCCQPMGWSRIGISRCSCNALSALLNASSLKVSAERG